jgi:dienelactone hydrolase
MRSVLLALLLFATATHAETVKIKWTPSDAARSSEPWLITEGGAYLNGWSANFVDGTVEERRRVVRDGFLTAEIIKPKTAGGPLPFVILIHGCSGMTKQLQNWAHDYASAILREGYGVLVLDSFTSRGVNGICNDPSQLNWARRRADDAYSALNYLIETRQALADKVFLVGRSNGATTGLIVMNQRIGELYNNKFAGAFLLQPSCLYMRPADFYGPIRLFLAEKDDATSPTLCLAMISGRKRQTLLEAKVFKDAHHGFEDKVPLHKFNGWRMGYNAAAATQTINAITAELKTQRTPALAR